MTWLWDLWTGFKELDLQPPIVRLLIVCSIEISIQKWMELPDGGPELTSQFTEPPPAPAASRLGLAPTKVAAANQLGCHYVELQNQGP